MNLYKPDNARSLPQRVLMEELEALGICVFCPGPRRPASAERIDGTWWMQENEFPRPLDSVSLLIYPQRHVTGLEWLFPGEWLYLRSAIETAARRRSVRAYKVEMRCGNMEQSGASVAHLHLHIRG